MKIRIWLILALTVLAGLALTLVSGLGQVARAQEEFGDRPTPQSADALNPAAKPSDERQVALLTLHILSNDEGKVESVEFAESEFLPGFSPNVFGLSGAWTIALVGEELITYGVLDPRLVRVEGEGDAPHSSFIDPDVEWELVVPLFDGDKNLQVEAIAIADENGDIVFAAKIDSGSLELQQIKIDLFLDVIRERGGFIDTTRLGPQLFTIGE